ncbi:MAG: hypothetical protein NVS4B5_12110 [Vulcanimicrobiaceae bacterium]
MVAMFDIPSFFAALVGRSRPQTPLACGQLALERGDYAGALAAFEAAESTATSPRALATLANKRGVALVRSGERQRGLAAFALALRHDPRCAPALTNLGNLLHEDGHTLDAIDYYVAATQADPTYALAHRNLGVACKALGRHDDAVRSLRTATRLAAKRRGST